MPNHIHLHPIYSAEVEHAEHHEDTVPLGVWAYVMSDCVLFAALFATYAVLGSHTGMGESQALHMGQASPSFSLPLVLIETLVLLTSSFTCGLAVVASVRKNKLATWIALGTTFILSATFLLLELSEFATLVREGNGWQTSAHLSSFFTLVGTHGLHIFVGLLWIIALFLYIGIRGLDQRAIRRIGYFSLFWHFLDIIWIFIFSFVYLFSSL